MLFPYNRIASFFHEVFGLDISQGPFVNWVNEARKKAEPAIAKIKELIMQSEFVGLDESNLYCSKCLDWAWIGQTAYFTLQFHGKGRGGKELENGFDDSLERMTAVTDRHSAYFALNFLNHQVCIPHLLWELQYLNEQDSNQQWQGTWKNYFKKLSMKEMGTSQAVIDKKPWLKRIDILLTESLEGFKEQFGKLRKGLIKYRDYIFNFLENQTIPSDNNASERGIRIVKIKMTNSGTFHSDQRSDVFLDLLSIVETTKKHNLFPSGYPCFMPSIDRFHVLMH